MLTEKTESLLKGIQIEKNAAEKKTIGKKLRELEFTRHGLKCFSLILLLVYTFGMSVVRIGILHLDKLSPDALNHLLETDRGAMTMAGVASVFQLMGGLSIPVFAFLLAEGMVHTASWRRYLGKLLVFAVISEIPYDLAMQGSWMDFSAQNPLFTLAICLVMLYGLHLLENKKGAGAVFLRISVIAAALLWCQIFNLQFGLVTVLLSAVYYGFRERAGLRILMGCGISAVYVTAPFASYILYNYNGLPGKERNRYLYYAFYPVHLLLAAGITMLIR